MSVMEEPTTYDIKEGIKKGLIQSDLESALRISNYHIGEQINYFRQYGVVSNSKKINNWWFADVFYTCLQEASKTDGLLKECYIQCAIKALDDLDISKLYSHDSPLIIN